MGLYDQVQQTNTPYISQFVGSPVKELGDYSQLVQGRYNDAANSDDSLSEALGNMGHLGLDADTQYANELKSQYYNRIGERAQSGDFENMGRRTRQDAIKFSQAYMPLLQRQRDMADIVKRVNSDQNIADPEKKQQILQYIQHLNSIPRDPTSGDFQRDANGRIYLGGIQDWGYAKDVDINKKLTDLLSKKEADINAGKYFSDGHGNLINTIEKVRDPRYIAQLADEMQKSDPEIKAMISRDALLQTYHLTPDEVKQHLIDAGLDKSDYQKLKAKGINDHEIGPNVSRVAPLDSLKAQYMANGYSEPAAERAILGDQVQQSMRNTHSGLVGGILGYKQLSNEHMTDHMAVIRATAAANAIKDPNLTVLQGNGITTSQEDPESSAKTFVNYKQDLQNTATNAQTAIQAAMKATGVATGDPKKDISTAIELMHNPVKLNALKLELAKSHPQEALMLENLAQSYKDKEAINSVQQQHVEDMEKAGGMDWNTAYRQYVLSHPRSPLSYMLGTKYKVPSMDEYKDMVRSDNAGADYLNYQSALKRGAQAINDGTEQAAGYHPIIPTGAGKADKLTSAINDFALNGSLTGIDLNHPENGAVDIAKAMGIDGSNFQDKKTKAMEKGLQIRPNIEGVGGKPTVSVTGADGTTKVFQVQNLPPGIQDELNTEVVRAGAAASTSTYGKHLLKTGLVGLGTSTLTDNTLQYLKTVNPGASGVVKSLNDKYAIRVQDAGAGQRQYQLLRKMPDGKTTPMKIKPFDSLDDLGAALGQEKFSTLLSKPDEDQLNRQR